MSRRHERTLLPLTDPELTAHARAERQRIRASLARLEGARTGDADAIDEPGARYRHPHHRGARNAIRSREYRHWKQAFWKRRSALRRERALIELSLRHT